MGVIIHPWTYIPVEVNTSGVMCYTHVIHVHDICLPRMLSVWHPSSVYSITIREVSQLLLLSIYIHTRDTIY